MALANESEQFAFFKSHPKRSRLQLTNIVEKLESMYRFLFASAVINLAELLGLRPDLTKMRKILYFHENQLVYPVRKQKDRDFQNGYNQIISCLAADVVVFNSSFNQESFLSSIKTFLSLMPDYKADASIIDELRPKCKVLHFPIEIQMMTDEQAEAQSNKSGPLHIVWAHRWEHDKNPDAFFDVIAKLKEEQLDFKVSVLGQGFTDVPEIFEKMKHVLQDHIVKWGYQETKEEFINTLKDADVAVSTAIHEFFGVSMLEAVSCGCYPLCPKRLVYPEIFPDEYLYNTDNQLFKRLRQFCKKPHIVRCHKVKIDLHRFSWDHLKKEYENLFMLSSQNNTFEQYISSEERHYTKISLTTYFV
eukprot:Seg3102.2 transcript_id=Seg3102.2/GoldUCD/mRNA.D3Y31 product="Glycosyltransferase-like domain-containing protein 1-like" protein_id=Seg3102.2/GoldUCD/D3Y31